MSYRAMNWAWNLTDLGMAESFILVSLADQANDDGFCWPSQATLAARSRQSERSVRRGLARLEEYGLIKVMRRSTQGGRQSNLYWLNVGADFSLQIKQPDNLAGCEKPVDNSPVENCPVDDLDEVEQALSAANKATGQSGRLRNRTECPVAQPDTRGRSQPDTGGRLQYRGKNHQLNHQTLPDPVPHQPGDELTPVGSGPVGQEQSGEVTLVASAASPASASASLPRVGGGDAELIAQCLPAWMHPMDAPGAAQVAGLLRERIAAGWTRSQIAALMDAPAPPTVRRLSSLVGYRLRENVSPSLAPTVLSRPSVSAQDDLERERAARSEALAGTRHASDPAWDAALETARQAIPDASWVELAVEARRLLALTEAAQPGGAPPAA